MKPINISDEELDIITRRGPYELLKQYIYHDTTAPSTARDFLMALESLGGKEAVISFVNRIDPETVCKPAIRTRRGYEDLNALEKQALAMVRSTHANNKSSSAYERRLRKIKPDRELVRTEPDHRNNARLNMWCGIAATVMGTSALFHGGGAELSHAAENAEPSPARAVEVDTNSPASSSHNNSNINHATGEASAGCLLLAAAPILLMNARAFERLSKKEQRKVIERIKALANSSLDRVKEIIAATDMDNDSLGMSKETSAGKKIAELLYTFTGRNVIAKWMPPEEETHQPAKLEELRIVNNASDRAEEGKRIKAKLQELGLEIEPDARGDVSITWDPSTWLPQLIKAVAVQQVAPELVGNTLPKATAILVEKQIKELSAGLEDYLGREI